MKSFAQHCTHLLFLAFLFVGVVEAQSKQVFPESVLIGIYINDITNFDVRDHSFDAEFYLWCKWKGPLNPTNLEFVNAKEFRKLYEHTDTDLDGTKTYNSKISGTFHVSLSVSDYPRDRHRLVIQIESFDYSCDSLVFQIDTLSNGLASDFIDEGWNTQFVGTSLSRNYFAPAQRDFSHFELAVEIARRPTAFFIRILIPLLVVVVMSMLAFFIPPQALEAQVGLGATALLTIIAFHLLVRDMLPDVDYLTRADFLIMGSYITILLALVETVVTHSLFRRDKLHIAIRVDKICRMAFPGIYLLYILVVLIK
jgi:hypothetical protein